MDVVKVIFQPVVSVILLVVPVKEHIDYMTSCKKYVRDMGTSMKELDATRHDVENHMKQNKGSNLEIPAHVTGWLEEVVKVDAQVNSIPSNVGSCFSFNTRHGVGKKAFKLTLDIKRLIEEHSRIVWTNRPIPLGKVDSMKASTSTPSVEYHSDFKSREETFMKALKALEPDHKSHMIALCGMGGVGKTTMMEKLKTVVTEKRMFNYIVKVVIGEKTDPFAIQDAVADYLAINLKEITSVPARADKLRGWFKNYSEGGKKKILVILDDIWQLVDLKDIGLTPFPDQGVDFKVLLTSRDRDVCIRMGVEADSILNVNVLEKVEAESLFWEFIKVSDEADLDPDLRNIGCDIVTRCQGLPIAIKTIAITLKGKCKGAWEDTLTKLQHHDIDGIVNEVFELSYNNLKDEQTKSVFLLCGLYPEDFDIPTEELVRYGWGLKLFNKVSSIGQGRNRLKTCIEQLVNANLLIESNGAWSIKMHDLVRAFVLEMYSKAEHASIVNHGNMSEWPANETPDSCKRISLACNGMEEFPGDFKYPNLSFLKLTHGDKSLRFPGNFYGLMEKLQVIVYEKMQYPLLPRSFEYSINLRTLCLHGCSLMFDCRSIGSLENLEVLSFANCGIRKLPSTIGNLKKLKLLDLTGCYNLHIDDGVLKNLVKLEELYMGVPSGRAIRFTDGNFNELAECSKILFAIEIWLCRNNTHLKRMSFNKLERFNISIGCFLEGKDEKTTENTLTLESNKDELLESGINVLFVKTDVLCLQVDGMYVLEDFKCSSFHRLRVLRISSCAQLRYLFTRRVASTLIRLEHLGVWFCHTLQTIIHDENNGSEPITFPSLKFLSLGGLPKLAGLCSTGNVIELPQLIELQLVDLPDFISIFPGDNLASSSMSSETSTMQPFLNEKVAIPRLETLRISQMNKLSKIWSSEVTRSENVSLSMLKTIDVYQCDRLVNVFPTNPMPLLHHLKELNVERCDSIETIFKIDMGCVPEITREGSSSLVRIVVLDSQSLRHVWSLENVDSSYNINHHIHGFEAVESITISDCGNFRDVFTPITADFNLKALQQLNIGYYGKISSVESSPDQQNNVIPRDIGFPSHLIHAFHQLRTLDLESDKEAQVVFDIESASGSGELSTSQNYHHQLLPFLEELTLEFLDNMRHVWNPRSLNQFFILQQPKSLCQNLTKITLSYCRSIKYLFSPIMFKFLSNLKHVDIEDCEVMEEIVSSRDDEDGEIATSTSTHTNDTFFPILEMLTLQRLKSLQHIGGGGGNQFQSKGIGDNNNNNNNNSGGGGVVVSSSLTLTNITILPDLRNLRRLCIYECPLLKDVFPFSTLQSLTKLQNLEIESCDGIRVIVKEEEEDGNHTTSSSSDDHQVPVVFPCLKSIYLDDIPNLVGFFLGTNSFRWPVLDEVEILRCPKLRMFTKGDSDSPMLKYVFSDMGENSVECGKINNLFHHPSSTTTAAFLQEEEEQQQVPFAPSLDGSTSLPPISPRRRMPWFYYNLINVHVSHRRGNGRFIIGHNELQHVEKIEKFNISYSSGVKEIFETFEMSSGLNQQTHSVLEVREMEFYVLDIKCLWKTKQWAVLKFPNLTRLSIDHCGDLKHVFTTSMVGSLLQLQELAISNCKEMEIIVVEDEKEDETEKEQNDNIKEDEDDDERRGNEDDGKEREENDERRENKVEFRRLRTLTLRYLMSFKGFCLGMETIHWASLDTLEIKGCPKITTFTNGQSTTPKLRFILTNFGLCEVTEGVNSFIQTKIKEGYEFDYV